MKALKYINKVLPVSLPVICIWLFAAIKPQANTTFPLYDLHVHLSDSLSIEQAVQLSKERNMKFGIVEHPGICDYCPIQNDQQLIEYLDALRNYPVYVGLQPVVSGWRELFSDSIINKLEYVIMDAMEIPQEDGSIWRIWLEDTQVEDIDEFMEMYVNYHIKILEDEGFDILANATFLPKSIEDQYEIAWTKERMQRVIDAVVENDIAIEINSYYQVPNAEFIKMAKASGAKFSFGTNSRNSFAGTTDYARKMIEECGLEEKDIFRP